MNSGKQFLRKSSLLVLPPTPVTGFFEPSLETLPASQNALDLSDLRFTFSVQNADVQSPNACAIRVYNLSESTERKIRGEYSRVVLQAGYKETGFGVIFDGTIKQFRRGRESAIDTYLDILAADGDIGYNFGVCNKTLAAGSTPAERSREIAGAMGMQVNDAVSIDETLSSTGGTLPRGKVLFGMARDFMSCEAATRGATWSVQNGRVQITELASYLPGDAVVLNALNGLVGIPEQTEDGIRVRCLLNPRLRIGGRVHLDNRSINQTLQQNPSAAPVPYNQWTGIQLLAKVSNDGFYRLFVVEHHGDTRGQEWYSDLICLAIDKSSDQVKPYG